MESNKRNSFRSAFSRSIPAFTMLLLTFSAFSEPLEIFLGEIPEVHEIDGSGVYDQVLSKVMPSQYPYQLKVLPPKRAIRDFEACHSCCLSPANGNPEFTSYSSLNGFVELPPMNIAMPFIFSPYGGDPITELSTLKGKSIGMRHAMLFGKTFFHRAKEFDINLILAPTLNSLFRMLDQKRVSAVIAYTPDAYLFFTENSLKPYPHAKDLPIIIHADTMVCKNVSELFVESYRNNMKKIRDSGELIEILGDGAQILPEGIGTDFMIP